MKSKSLMRIAAPMVALALVGTACGGGGGQKDTTPTGKSRATATAPAQSGAAANVAVADLRSGLTGLLTEHVYLASNATGAALRGDNAGFQAYAAALNGPNNSNSADVVAAVGSVYGPEVEKAFDGLWRSNGHIPAFVAYTQAVAKNDKPGADKAVNDLLAYAKTFGTTMNQVNSNLPAAAVEEGIKMHITTLKSVVDAQKAGDQAKVYTQLREAYAHMGDLATTIADATAKKFPDKISGDANAPAAELGAGLTSLLREHVLLASSATGAALRGDNAGFGAAAAALNGPTNSNTADLVSAVGSVYGPEVEKAFDGLWRSNGHIPAFVAYTQAVAKNDRAGADKAVNDLMAYAKTFGTTMNQVNSNLPAAAVEEAIVMHATTLKSVVDAQKAKDASKEATDLRTAVHHMSDTAKVLADATLKKFPEKF
ncbi:MAG: hypothetical protein ABR592_11595 [Nitriliruptorales bacterium]